MTTRPRKLRAQRSPTQVRAAVERAKQILAKLRDGDADALTQATILQGVIAGDVLSAMFVARQRLQRENLALRNRIARARIKTEAVKQRLLSIEADNRSLPPQDPVVIINNIRALYGLPPTNPPLLSAPQITTEIIQEVPSATT
jgi:hypothetical protein